MSESVVFAKPPPVPDAICIGGAEGARGGWAGVGATGVMGSPPGRGGTDATHSRMGGVGTTGIGNDSFPRGNWNR